MRQELTVPARAVPSSITKVTSPRTYIRAIKVQTFSRLTATHKSSAATTRAMVSGTAFIYNLPTATLAPTITYPNSTYTELSTNLSNNGQVAGVAEFSSGAPIFFLYDENTITFTQLPSTLAGAPTGINDQGQLIGGLGSGAYLGTPQ
jgi:hypothetical protein